MIRDLFHTPPHYKESNSIKKKLTKIVDKYI